MKKPVLYMLVGFPLSGKSTWTKEHASSAVVVSTDAYIEERALEEGISYGVAFKKHISDAERNMFEVFEKAKAAQSDIVWDQTNLTKNKRRRIINMIGDAYDVYVVWFVCSEETLKARNIHRRDSSGTLAKFIPEAVLTSMRQNFEEPCLLTEKISMLVKVEHP